MKFTLIGTGKTGACVQELLPKGQLLAAFNSENPPKLSQLKKADASIIFVTGPVMTSLIPMLLRAKRPVISGATNVDWPPHLNEQLIEMGIPWISASNFSIGMNLMFHLCETLADNMPFFEKADVTLAETHHTDKKDLPSGTAKKIAGMFPEDGLKIKAQRQGNIVGTHSLCIETKAERLTLEHHAFDRRLYARGAIWAAQELIWQPHLKGLIWFEDLIKEVLIEKADKKHATAYR